MGRRQRGSEGRGEKGDYFINITYIPRCDRSLQGLTFSSAAAANCIMHTLVLEVLR